MSIVECSSSGHAAIPYDYGTEDKSFGSNTPSMLNGDLETFSWWKTKIYTHYGFR
jgi:hypothetical protein